MCVPKHSHRPAWRQQVFFISGADNNIRLAVYHIVLDVWASHPLRCVDPFIYAVAWPWSCPRSDYFCFNAFSTPLVTLDVTVNHPLVMRSLLLCGCVWALCSSEYCLHLCFFGDVLCSKCLPSCGPRRSKILCTKSLACMLVSKHCLRFPPTGLFVPMLVTGAVYGRIVGEFVNQYTEHTTYPGTYSLIGK